MRCVFFSWIEIRENIHVQSFLAFIIFPIYLLSNCFSLHREKILLENYTLLRQINWLISCVNNSVCSAMNCAGANLVPCRGSVQASDQYMLLTVIVSKRIRKRIRKTLLFGKCCGKQLMTKNRAIQTNLIINWRTISIVLHSVYVVEDRKHTLWHLSLQ